MNTWVKLRLDAIVREIEKTSDIKISYSMSEIEVIWFINYTDKTTGTSVSTSFPVDYKTATSPDMPRFIIETVKELQELEWNND